MIVVNEPGHYSLILKSRKPEAKAFKRWITHEVLPSIRKTGQYSTSEPQFKILKLTRKLEGVESMQIPGVKRVASVIVEEIPMVKIYWQSREISGPVPMMPYMSALLGGIGIYDPIKGGESSEAARSKGKINHP